MAYTVVSATEPGESIRDAHFGGCDDTCASTGRSGEIGHYFFFRTARGDGPVECNRSRLRMVLSFLEATCDVQRMFKQH